MCNSDKVIVLPVSKKCENNSYLKAFSWKHNYEQLNDRLNDFLREGNPNIYYGYKAKSLKDTEEFHRELYFQKEVRKEQYNITLIGRFIVIMWNIDYLIIPGVKRIIKRKVHCLANKIFRAGKPKLTIQK